MDMLTPKNILKRLLIALINRQISEENISMMFIIGHMRSGSTLLVHLLANHPMILGYGETHHNYQTVKDFGAVSYKILRKFNRYLPKEDYILDKVLHEEKGLTSRLTKYKKTKVILLVREPERSIKSILSLGLDKTSSEAKALEYYKERLKTIEEFATRLSGDRCCFLTYEHLVENSLSTLKALTNFLNLSSPLKDKYESLWSTGIKGLGDSSDSIRTGKITKAKKNINIALSKNTIEEANNAFDKCLQQCRTLSLV
ncbi:hypothetical protein HNR65_003363 [Desulfosalsimonas propionicica]|uniref:Sulfotransferase domain-containing protein n=1 Tax=Desulfosalsimonas propionicica TaxID=332175 RepID=A0A7W0CC56_9BACT|nr:sulfotransferase [Desulfosalsimonas propionicica]MBA2883006.1 hypothetical protein [Desulfosalsimonas propionicica]